MFNKLFLLAFFVLGVYCLYSCNDRQVTPGAEEVMKGQTDFVSAGRNQRGEYVDDTAFGGPEKNGEGGSGTTRSIEEGDIVRLVNKTLFILNQYRGLQIVDLTDVESPELISSVPIYGYPVEMYVRDSRVYVVVSNYFSYTWGLLGAADGSNAPFYGSIIRVVDISDLKNPKIIGGFQIEGNITDTRIVGDVLYAVSNRYSYMYYYYNTRDNEDLTTVFAINIADPKNIYVSDKLEFPRSNTAYDNNVHVTSDTIYVSQYKWGYYNEYGYYVEGNATDITYIDISDPDGRLAMGARFEVAGVVLNRWQMDYYNGYFRVITPDKYWGNGFPKLYVFRVSDKDNIKPVATLRIEPPRPESLTSVRFDRERAYAVTYEQKDPLFIIDISDPERPQQKGELEMSGWLDYIEPRGDILIALGHDNANDEMTLAVSMFDVSDVNNPKMISRVNFGEGWGWVPTEINDIHKAFKVLDDINLVIVPFSSWSYKDDNYVSGIQLIDYFSSGNSRGLVRRGLVEHSGWVQRGIPYAGEKLLTVSNEAVQVVDISNRDRPLLNADIELARNSIDFLPIDSNYGLELSTDTLYYWRRSPKSKINLLPLANPNTVKPYQSLSLDGYFTKLYRVGPNYAAVGYTWDSNSNNYKIIIKSFAIRNSILTILDETEFLGNYGWYHYGCPMYYDRMGGVREGGYYYGGCYNRGSVAEQLPDGRLIFANLKYDYESNEEYYHYRYTVTFKQIRIKEDGSIESSNDFTFSPPVDSYIGGLVYQNMKGYLTYYVPLNLQNSDVYYSKAYVKVVDLSEFDKIRSSSAVNVPGTVIGASLSGKYIYTLDYQYFVDKSDNYRTVGYLNTLYLGEEKAYLQDKIEILPYSTSYSYNYIGSYLVKDEKIYYTLHSTICDSRYERCTSSSSLKTISLVDPQEITLKSTLALNSMSTGTMNIIAGRLFITTYDYVSGFLVYKLADPFFPEFEAFYRTDGWSSVDNVSASGNKAYVTAGPYGIQIINLK